MKPSRHTAQRAIGRMNNSIKTRSKTTLEMSIEIILSRKDLFWRFAPQIRTLETYFINRGSNGTVRLLVTFKVCSKTECLCTAVVAALVAMCMHLVDMFAFLL
jgi:hypothetical protein